MLQTGKALKVSIYVNEGSTHHGSAAATSILDYLFYRNVSGATVLKGVAGFGSDHRISTDASVEISDRLPVKIEFIETPEKVEELMGKLQELAGTGMIEVQETTIVKAAAPEESAPPLEVAHHRWSGKAKLMRIYVNEDDRWDNKPLHEALTEALRANEVAGVTAYKSVLSFGQDREIRERSAFGGGTSIMLSTVDSEERLRSVMPTLERMMPNGLVVLSDVDVVSYRQRT